jgi:hypothetical protein
MSGALLAIDPGTSASGWVIFDGSNVRASGVSCNEAVLTELLGGWQERLAIEMIASYGMPVGAEVFETCVWIGRFIEAFARPAAAERIYRRDVKLELCGSPRAKDANIRQALIDRLGPPGTKKTPGPTYGVRSHAWAALGVAVTVWARTS